MKGVGQAGPHHPEQESWCVLVTANFWQITEGLGSRTACKVLLLKLEAVYSAEMRAASVEVMGSWGLLRARGA